VETDAAITYSPFPEFIIFNRPQTVVKDNKFWEGAVSDGGVCAQNVQEEEFSISLTIDFKIQGSRHVTLATALFPRDHVRTDTGNACQIWSP